MATQTSSSSPGLPPNVSSSVLACWTARAEIREVLERFTPDTDDKEFASFGALSRSEFVSPDVVVEGVGPLTLPLSEDQALALIVKARQAPFGKGSQTIVDTSVRRTWELDPSQFSLNNPAWPAFLEKLCSRVEEELGVGGKVHAELYKMLIYEEGAMFKPHRDSEKAPGMFGTLVICLPSPHKGGEVVVRHGKHQDVFETATAQPSYACWYADVLHEVLPVRAGYRWVLTYNLTRPSAGSGPSAPELVGNSVGALRESLSKWIENSPSDDLSGSSRRTLGEKTFGDHGGFCHKLGHEYTEAGISMHDLKSSDRRCVQALCEACKDLPVDIFLALLEKEEQRGMHEDPWSYEGGGWYEEEEVEMSDEDEDEDEDAASDANGRSTRSESLGYDLIDIKYLTTKLVDLQGNELCKMTLVDKSDLLQPEEDFFEEEADEVENSGYTGNEGVTETHWYRESAVIVVKRDSVGKFFARLDRGFGAMECEENIVSLAKYFIAEIQRPSDRAKGLDHLRSFVNKSSFVKSELADLCQSLVESLQHVEFKQSQWSAIDDATEGAPGTREPVSLELWRFVIGVLGDYPEIFQSVEQKLVDALLAYRAPWKRFKILDRLKSLQATIPGQQLCSRQILASSLEVLDSLKLGELDGKYMGSVVASDGDFEYFKASVLPPLESKIRDSAFVLAFLSELRTPLAEGVFPAEGWQIWARLAMNAIPAIDMQSIHDIGYFLYRSFAEHDDPYPRTLPETTRTMMDGGIRPDTFVKFMECLLSPELPTGVMWSFVSKLVGSADRIPANAFEQLWVPVLAKFIPVLEAHGVPLTTQLYQQLFTVLLTKYVKLQVGLEPKPLAPPPAGPRRRGFMQQWRKKERTLHARHAEWANRKAAAQKQFRGMGLAKLTLLLGEEFTAITGLQPVRPPVQPQPQPQASTSTVIEPPAAAPSNASLRVPERPARALSPSTKRKADGQLEEEDEQALKASRQS